MIAFLAEISGYERVEAVHKTFADKSNDEVGVMLFWMFVILTAALAFLAFMHRVQDYHRKRDEAKRRARRPTPTPASDGMPEFGSSRPTVSGVGPPSQKPHPSVRS